MMSTAQKKASLSFSGRLAQQFQDSAITPLLALVGLLLGLFAVFVTPQEEEPQISVTFANIFIPFPGASTQEVEQLVTTPAEQILSEVDDVDHVYSVSSPGMSVLTVRYKVGKNRNDAILSLYNAIFSNQDWLPQNLGVGQPLIKPKGIDDVPVLTLTLWEKDQRCRGCKLGQIAHSLEAEIKRISGTRNVYTVGGEQRVVHVLLDPEKLASFGLDINDLQNSLQGANTKRYVGKSVKNNEVITLEAGTFFSEPEEIGDLVVRVDHDRPVYLKDVAQISLQPNQPKSYVWLGTGPEAKTKDITVSGEFPAVTLAVSKKPGTNASQLTQEVINRVEALKGYIIPEGVEVTVTRDYGLTAKAKANKLIGKLAFATFFVVLLVLLTMGWREALIVGLAVSLTLMITLFASWVWGFTLNRVSLFALIFSIGILVDDAIVVVENIHRHMHMSDDSLLEIIPRAVDEIGGPTILATMTVIAALLPMAFVTGLMGPYMSPIPINASTGMVISLAIALVVTPWLTHKILRRVREKEQAKKRAAAEQTEHTDQEHKAASPGLLRFFNSIYKPFMAGRMAVFNRILLFLGIAALIVLSVGLVAVKQVVLKMLPFDNKSEFQVVVDMPEGTPLEQTSRVLAELASYLATVPEISDYQVYAGTASPVGFNGLVRQYYLRSGDNIGDIQVNLIDAHHRKRKSHEIAQTVRPVLYSIGQPYGANVKVVEVPPGPPVQSPLVAEIYGPDYPKQMELARQVHTLFTQTPDVVDVDDTLEFPARRQIIEIDRQRAAKLGLSQAVVVNALNMAIQGSDATFFHTEAAKYAVPIRLELPISQRADFTTLKLRNQFGNMIALSEVIQVKEKETEYSIYHKDLLRTVYVTGDMAGKLDSPLYAMFEIVDKIKTQFSSLEQKFIVQPDYLYHSGIKWDGEWQVTYETFRDMGIAYTAGLVLIYLLVVAQFRSYLVPLVIMAPIPLTVIGVMPGHALLGAQFTATSMIGMIALAGIIVRNSILLVDFINEEMASGASLTTAVIHSGAVRAKPIVLTGLAAMLGAFFILDDPIFSGLAIALIFGIFISTILTLWIIPLLYYMLMSRQH